MRTACLSLLMLFAGCGPLLDAGVELEEFCRDVETREVRAAPVAVRGSWSWSGEWETPELPIPEGTSVQLELDRVELHPAGGVEALDFIEAAEVDVEQLHGGEVGAFSWTPEDGRTVEVIGIDPSEDLDLSAFVDAGAARVTTTLTGTLPTVPWSLKIRACYRASAQFAWSPY